MREAEKLSEVVVTAKWVDAWLLLLRTKNERKNDSEIVGFVFRVFQRLMNEIQNILISNF